MMPSMERWMEQAALDCNDGAGLQILRHALGLDHFVCPPGHGDEPTVKALVYYGFLSKNGGHYAVTEKGRNAIHRDAVEGRPQTGDHSVGGEGS